MTRRRSWVAQSARRSGGGPHAPSRAKREEGRDWRANWEAEREAHENRLREAPLQGLSCPFCGDSGVDIMADGSTRPCCCRVAAKKEER